MGPGARLNKINALLHLDPYASIVYCIFWLVVLCGIVPMVAGLVLLPLTVYRILAWRYDWIGANDYDPATEENATTTEMAVVITGCDSGFGKELALWAADAGYVVFAGCLDENSFGQFDVKSRGRVVPLKMDVTDDGDVSKAADRVTKWIGEERSSSEGTEKKRVLHALVNNAGIARSGCFDWLQVSDYESVMNVNFFGTLRCCKAFLPTLKKQAITGSHRGGRIINLTSMAGLAPGGELFASPYIASKHAAQTFTESLRKELAVFGIEVTSVNPSFHKTPMVSALASGDDVQMAWDRMTPVLREEYGDDVLAAVTERGQFLVNALSWDIEVVLDQVLQVLKSRKTPGQVLVGLDARFLFVLTRMLPGWFMALVGGNKRLIPAVMKDKCQTK